MNQDSRSTSSSDRDHLALVRTDLANERTLLAYGRTGLMVLGSGVTLIKFFSDSAAMITAGWGLSSVGVLVAAVGLIRFIRLNRSLHG